MTFHSPHLSSPRTQLDDNFSFKMVELLIELNLQFAVFGALETRNDDDDADKNTRSR